MYSMTSLDSSIVETGSTWHSHVNRVSQMLDLSLDLNEEWQSRIMEQVMRLEQSECVTARTQLVSFARRQITTGCPDWFA